MDRVTVGKKGLTTPGGNETNSPARLGQHTLDTTAPLSQLQLEPAFDGSALLTEIQQCRLADRLPPQQIRHFVYTLLPDISDMQDFTWLQTRLDGIERDTQIPSTEKNFQMLQELRKLGGNRLIQHTLVKALHTCQLSGLITPVFEPEKDSGGHSVFAYLADMSKRLPHEQQQRVIDKVEKLLTPPTIGWRAADVLMRQLPNDSARLECLQRAERLALTASDGSPDRPLQISDIQQLTTILTALGHDTYDLAMQLLLCHHSGQFLKIQRNDQNKSTNMQVMDTLMALATDQGFLHQPNDINAPLTLRQLARLIDNMGYEVLADQLLASYGLAPLCQPEIETMPEGLLSQDELGRALYAVYLQKTGSHCWERWQEVATMFGLPQGVARDFISRIGNDNEQSAALLAQRLDETSMEGITWHSFSKTVVAAGLPQPARSIRTKSYRRNWNRPDEQLLKLELQSYSSQWRLLGSRLNFKTHILDDIQTRCHTDTEQALDQLLTSYMRRRTACWDQIIDVLEQINQTVAAGKLREKYFPGNKDLQRP